MKDYVFACEPDLVDLKEFVEQWGSLNLDGGFSLVQNLHLVSFK